MFRASPDNRQIDLLSNIEQYLRPRDQEKLNDANAWHNVFLDQAKRLSVVGEKLRMDSTLLDSNLATCTRLQLIIACLQEF
jgi:hypothetical protein